MRKRSIVGAWLSLFAMLMIFAGPLISQGISLAHGKSQSMSMAGMECHDMAGMSQMSHHCSADKHHALIVWEKCGYCSLLFQHPALTESNLAGSRLTVPPLQHLPALSLLANYAYTQAEVTGDNSIPVGDGLPRMPKHSGRLAARYRILDGAAKGLGFGAGITALSAREVTLPNTVSVPGYALLDAQTSYEFDRYTVSVSAVNLTGRKVFETYQYLGSPVVLPTQPRSAFLTLTAIF